ncbi:uncharacterized protein VTP21DRAFT_7267 [Calcarisporiella thermophila]|uniref:uncharacterized protein n=1 Tax=Calcarisporiella thermophila TaxID=911321 RepID=UPI003741F4C3
MTRAVHKFANPITKALDLTKKSAVGSNEIFPIASLRVKADITWVPEQVRIAVVDVSTTKTMLFNVMIEDEKQVASLTRGIPDFVQLDKNLQRLPIKSRPNLPNLEADRRRSFLFSNLFPFSTSKKTVAEKLGIYLQKVMTTELLALDCVKDFFYPRIEDSYLVRDEAILEKHQQQQCPKPEAAEDEAACSIPIKRSRDSFTLREVQMGDFDLIKVLGKGCMGKVLLVRDPEGQLRALKAINKDWVVLQREIEHTKTERDILAAVARTQHPFLMRLFHAFQTNEHLVLVMQYYPGGDIASQLARWYKFDPERARLYAAEIVLGLEELHRLGVVYRDLKPENILIGEDGHLVLTDFGLSKKFSSEEMAAAGENDLKTSTFCGTAEYLAPELLRAEEYDFSVDWWSLGTLLYEMLTGYTPFWADTQQDMFTRVLEDDVEFPADFDEDAADLIWGLLQRDPAKRLGSAEGAAAIKAHPYFASLDWEAVRAKRVAAPYVPELSGELDFSHFDECFLEMEACLSPPEHDLSEDLREVFADYAFNETLAVCEARARVAESVVEKPVHRPKKRRAAELDEECEAKDEVAQGDTRPVKRRHLSPLPPNIGNRGRKTEGGEKDKAEKREFLLRICDLSDSKQLVCETPVKVEGKRVESVKPNKKKGELTKEKKITSVNYRIAATIRC